MQENDFKYVIQDFSNTQLGARFTYEEMLMNDRVPFKYQSIISLYILKNTSPDVELGNHILSLNEDDYSFQVYRQLKVKVTFCQPKKAGGFKVITKKFPEFKEYQKNNWDSNHVLQHITISNLALIGFTV